MRNTWLVPAGAIAAVLVVAACGSTSSTSSSGGSGGSGSSPAASGPAAASGAALTTAKVSGSTLLTNAKGFTLYWFVPDTTTASKCNGITRDLAVLHGNAVDEARRRQGHVRHIEHPVVTAAHALEQAGNFEAENPVHLLHGKSVMSGRHRGVGSKHTAVTDCLCITLADCPGEVTA